MLAVCELQVAELLRRLALYPHAHGLRPLRLMRTERVLREGHAPNLEELPEGRLAHALDVDRSVALMVRPHRRYRR